LLEICNKWEVAMHYKVFIAYSGKSSRLADAIVNGLDPELGARKWPNAFQLGEGTFDGLAQKAKQYDFGIFALTPADFQKAGGRTFLPPNIMFELGLFVGAKGKGRAFLFIPQDHDNDLPADLRGITYASYDPKGELSLAVEHSCSQVQRQIYEFACSDCHFLLNKDSGKCMDVHGFAKSDGIEIIQWPYHGGSNQLWSLEKLAEDWFKITSKNSGKCLQVRDASLEENAPVEQGSYSGEPHQQWSFTLFPGGTYQVRVKHSGKCLAVEEESRRAPVVQRTWDGTDTFLWWIAVSVALT
jgi:hypothetical protein